MEEGDQRRVARNEARFREVNEAIERGLWPGERDALTTFRCECARLDCNRLVSITPAEYERVRADGRRFLLLPGHEDTEVETVVEVRTGYVIVEKRDQAGRSAEARDPRS
jgi:hypothetical protein